jgi:hypothetical protein
MYDLYYKDVRLIGSTAGSFGMWYARVIVRYCAIGSCPTSGICRYAADGVYVQTKLPLYFQCELLFLESERGEDLLVSWIEERLTDFNSVNAATAHSSRCALHTTEQWV